MVMVAVGGWGLVWRESKATASWVDMLCFAGWVRAEVVMRVKNMVRCCERRVVNCRNAGAEARARGGRWVWGDGLIKCEMFIKWLEEVRQRAGSRNRYERQGV